MSDVIKFSKVVSALPATLESNTIYFVKTGLSALVYVTNDLGLVVATPITVDLSSKADLIHSHDLATITDAGFMSAADKIKLDNSVSLGSATTEVLSNETLKHLNAIRSSAYVSLDFINNNYKANYGAGLFQQSLNTIVSGSRSNIKLAHDEARTIDDGMCTYHVNNDIYTALTATDVPPIATKYAPADYAVGGIYQYRGQWAPRIEKKCTSDLVGAISVSSDRSITGGLLIEPKSKNLCAYPPVYTAVNGTTYTWLDTWINVVNLPVAAIDLLPGTLIGDIPDSNNACQFDAEGNIGRCYIQQQTSSAVVSGEVYTWSVYVSIYPGQEISTLFLELGNAFPAAAHCSFIVSDVNGHHVFTATGQGASCLQYSIEHLENEYAAARISITAEANSNSIAHLRVGLGLATDNVLTIVDTIETNSIEVRGEQFENSYYPSSLIYPFDSVKSVRGSDVVRIPEAVFFNDYIAHDGLSPYSTFCYKFSGAWVIINVDHLLNINGYEHVLISVDNDIFLDPADSSVFALSAVVQSASQILFKLWAYDAVDTIASDTVLATIDCSKPFTAALKINYTADTATLLVCQGDSAITSLSLAGTEGISIIPAVDIIIGALPLAPGLTSTNDNATMHGHIRNFEVYPLLTSSDDIELIMKNYDH